MLKKRLILFLLVLFSRSSPGMTQQNLEDSLNKVIAEYKDEAEVSRAYNALAYEYSRKDPVKTRYYLSAAITIAKKINNRKRLSNAYSQLLYFEYDAGRPDSAEYYLNLVKDLVKGAPESEKDALTSNYNAVAAMFYKKTGSYQKAIPFFENAIRLFKKMGDKESTAGQMLNLGNTYTVLGNYQKATEQHLRSLKLFEEVGSDRGISFCYQSLSSSFAHLKQYNQALVYAKKSIQLKTALKDRRGIGTAESGLGDIYFGLGDLDKALEHFTMSSAIAREMKNKPEEQESYLNMAKVYAAKKELTKAVDYFNRSKALAKELHDSSSLASIDAELIALQRNTKETGLAEDKLKTTLQLFEERGDLNRRASGLKNMADFYAANKQFDKALEYTNKYYLATDSIRNNELQLQVKKMEEEYNSVKKEKEIELLKKDKELQQQKLFRQRALFGAVAALLVISLLSIGLLVNRSRLRQRMKELELRNQIAADLHDEVGSSLSSIHMLSQLATVQGSDSKQKDVLEKMSSNAKETMEKMGDIVWMIKPGESEGSSLKQRMERFAYEICSSRNIAATIALNDLEKVKLTIEQRKNLYLIFKEALNNAVKYSGTEKIDIKTSSQNKQLLLQVKDYGNGFDPEIAGNGNGLYNMKNRAKELNGKLDLISGEGIGTSVQLTMPL